MMCRLIAAWDPAGLTNAPSGRQQALFIPVLDQGMEPLAHGRVQFVSAFGDGFIQI